MSDDSLTIIKFKLGKDYLFKVFDKFDAEDEPQRLDLAIDYSAGMADIYGDMYQEIWIKTCPIFATR